MEERLVALAGMGEMQQELELAGHGDHSIFPIVAGSCYYYCLHCCCAGTAGPAAYAG